MKTEQELKHLAKRIYNGEIFICNDPEKIRMSFMILLLMDPKDMPQDVGAVYEEWSQAGPRSINGLPIFFSCRFLTGEETKKVYAYLQQLEELMKSWGPDKGAEI